MKRNLDPENIDSELNVPFELTDDMAVTCD